MREISYTQAINEGIDQSMQIDKNLICFGLGTTDPKGIFGTTLGLEKKYGKDADNLHTSIHEVIGHASGQIVDGVGTPKDTLNSYASTLEEARADLVGLYFIPDKKMEELGVAE